MLHLTLSSPPSVGAGFAALDDPGARSWHFSDGAVTARCHSANGRHSVDIPAVARFTFGERGAAVQAHVCPGAAAAEVAEAYRRFVLPFALRAMGHEVLHASAVSAPAGVVALCAASGTGKSTLAYGLSRRGLPLWSDDLVAWSARDGCALAEPLAFELRLRAASSSYFGLAHTPVYLPSPVGARARPLAAVCVLVRRAADAPGPVIECVRLTPPRAFAALLPHAYCFDPADRAGRQRLVQGYLALVGGVPAWEVRFREGWENLEEVLDCLAQAVHEEMTRV
jgi:hypothetical protein